MDAQLIEKFDKRRYRAMVLMTVGLGAMVGPYIILTLLKGIKMGSPLLPTLGAVAGFLMMAGFVTLVVGGVKHARNQLLIAKNPELKRALNDELFKLYEYKATKIAFWMVMIFVGVVYLVDSFHLHSFTAGQIAFAAYFIGGMSGGIAQLVYMRK